MSDKEKIKQEIERIIEEETPISKGSDYYHGVKESMEKLLQFIDSLPEEPASEDLEKEIENWMKRYVVGKDLRIINNDGADITPSDISQIARHFADWQRKKDQQTIELAEDHAMLAGMEKMREEMMKDAVDAFVNTYENTDDGNYVEFVTEQSRPQLY